MDDLDRLPDYGIFKLSLSSAARLICVDLWFSGEIEANVPHAESYSEDDPRFEHWLANDIRKFEIRLAEAVSRGTLKTVLLSQDFDEHVFVENTFVDYGELCDWLERHGHLCGDAFESYFHKELDLQAAVLNDLRLRRNLASRTNSDGTHGVSLLLDNAANLKGEPVSDELRAAIRNLLAENHDLNARLYKRGEESTPVPEKNLSTRERNSLLKVMVALCQGSSIDLNERGVAQQISEITESAGVGVGYETILKFVRDAKQVL